MAAVKKAVIVYCTSNDGKFAEASSTLLNELGHLVSEVRRADVDCVEIQGSAFEIAVHKAQTGARLIDASILDGADFILSEDVGLRLGFLNGFPGNYCKPMLEAIGVPGLWDLCARYPEENRLGEATCHLGVVSVADLVVASTSSNELPKAVVFEGVLKGTMVAPRGTVMHGKASWNACFLPEGFERTFGELQFEEQAKMSHRRRALMKFADSFLLKKQ
jgi:non-canonical purine NTP pyrophosphatase (RdgB/HAM1 family)